MQTAMAVNTALLALMKSGVYCTEPFRVPMAGKIDSCLFDKTGTITSDKLVAVGVVDVSDLNKNTSSSSSSSSSRIATNRMLENVGDYRRRVPFFGANRWENVRRPIGASRFVRREMGVRSKIEQIETKSIRGDQETNLERYPKRQNFSTQSLREFFTAHVRRRHRSAK